VTNKLQNRILLYSFTNKVRYNCGQAHIFCFSAVPEFVFINIYRSTHVFATILNRKCC